MSKIRLSLSLSLKISKGRNLVEKDKKGIQGWKDQLSDIGLSFCVVLSFCFLHRCTHTHTCTGSLSDNHVRMYIRLNALRLAA